MSNETAFMVLHGSGYVDVSTVGECYSTPCKVCAYQLQKIDKDIKICSPNCYHKVDMFHAKNQTDVISDYVPSTSRAYYYRAHAALKKCARLVVCSGVDCYADYNLQIHHIDGDIRNNSISNLKYLCIGCHALEHPDRAELIARSGGVE